MTLFSIALKNVKRNFYNYFVYVVSMVFSIMIYYVFTSIKYNEQVLALANMEKRITTAFSLSSVVIAIFAAIFIWYSNAFFTRKRKKEVGLYSLMGVKKRQIGSMLFYENLFMGVLALGAGIGLGSILSKIFVMLLVKLMGFSVNIKFVIMPKAILDTTFIFLIFFILTSIHGYTIIYRFKLVDLFKAEQQGEKEPKASVLKALLAVILIGGGYFYYITTKQLGLHTLLITLVLVVVGTYLFFSSLTLFLIKLARRNKKKYYSGINMIGTSQLLYRIKRHSRTLATIAVLSATTLTAMGVTSSFYYDFQANFNARFPFSYSFRSPGPNVDQEIEKIFANHPENAVLNSLEVDFIQLQGRLPQVMDYQKTKDDTIHLISASKFNQVVEITKSMEPITLTNASEVVVLDPFYVPVLMESYLGKKVTLHLGDEKEEYRVVGDRNSHLLNTRVIFSVVIVSDELYERLYSEGKIVKSKNIIVENEKQSKGLTDELAGYITKLREEDDLTIWYSSYYRSYRYELSGSGLTIFIGAFLGLVFLLSTGSIIFFKQLSEASDDQKTYHILKNIGVNKKEVKTSIAKQMLFVFALPLFVGIVHSWVALSLLDKFLQINLLLPITTTTGAYTLIYMIYYLLTVKSYTKTVNSPV